MKITDKISNLRSFMKANQVQAYIIPSSDPHQSEYVADRWMSRTWLSGFTGSAGTVVVTTEKAGLWTDSRYFLQAEEQLTGTGITLYKVGQSDTPSILEFLTDNLGAGNTVACDGSLFTVSQVEEYEDFLTDFGIGFEYDLDAISPIWKDRPALPKAEIFLHDKKYAGKSHQEKLELIRKKMQENDADLLIVSALDDIAWIFNIRGRDVACNPVAIAYAVIERQRATIFIDEEKVSSDIRRAFEEDNIYFQAYENIHSFVQAFPNSSSVWVDINQLNALLYDAIEDSCLFVEQPSPATRMKAIKNKTEIQHIRNAMEKDAVALVRLYRWLEKEIVSRAVPEVEVAEKLASFRATLPLYYGESFDAIVGFEGNGAIVHYRAMPDTCKSIINEGMLLLDSGGQYLDGTTDITRTTYFGTPTSEQKINYTLVLKGHINLATAKFPNGTTGMQLDVISRNNLWKNFKNFGHGTGHGVGFFLNVHEGPMGIGPVKNDRYLETFHAGMYASNEPGFYKANEYGIRIENLVIVQESVKNEFGQFLEFETVTLFPIATNLIDISLLDSSEIDWLNDYHKEVFARISPHLSSEEAAWLEEKCKAI